MPRDGELPTQDGESDGEWHLADGDSPRKSDADAPDGDFPNSKIIDTSALAIHFSNTAGDRAQMSDGKDKQRRPPSD